MTPEDHARDLLMNLNSSNLHYSAQVTPFSIYITVRKKFRKTSNFVIPDQSSHQLQKTEADYIEHCNTVKQEKDTLYEKIEFLVASIKRSTEETLSMEKTFIDGKKVTKKLKNKNLSLKRRN